MNIVELSSIAEQAQSAQIKARAIGEKLTAELAGFLGNVVPGNEDPVLALLVGEEIAELAARARWSSLVLNPGSTSTKVAVYAGLKLIAEDDIPLIAGESDSVERRVELVLNWGKKCGLDFRELTGIAARGGFVAPVPVGTYRITEEMCDDLKKAHYYHASNMAVPMAQKLKEHVGEDIVMTITAPVTCDEVDVVHRITGSPQIRTNGSTAHYLNLQAVAELAAKFMKVDNCSLHLIGCHMGGGMSAARCYLGRMVQVIQAFGNMPSANRSGRLPFKDLLYKLERREYSLDDLRSEMTESSGGLLGLAGTNDFKALFKFRDSGANAEQKKKIDLLVEFFANRVAASILELAATKEPLDAIFLTGGLARDAAFCELIARHVPLAVPVVKVPGSIESQALTAGLLRACADPSSSDDYVEARDKLAASRALEDELLDIPIFEHKVLRTRDKMPLTSIDRVIAAAQTTDELPTIALVGADNEEAMLAAKLANREGAFRLARFVLVGPYAQISSLAWELDIPIDEENYFIVDSDTPVKRAMELLAAGVVDVIMKGSLPTAALLKGYIEGLKATGKMKKGAMLSHFALFEVPGRHRWVAVTDAAINPSPSVDQRFAILENAIQALHDLGLERPKVAVISSTEKPSDKVVSSMEGEAIAKQFKDRDDMIIEGPLSVDLSLSPESAREKRYQGKIRGDADLLLVPNLDVGNAVYKVFSVAGGATVAGTVIGGEVPLVLTSRGDTSRSKFSSIALSLVLARENRKRKAR